MPLGFQKAVAERDLVQLLVHDSGVQVPELAKVYKNQRTHDPSDLAAARQLAEDDGQMRLGLFFQDASRPRYEDIRRPTTHTAEEKVALLEKELDRYAV
jgi:hypothetical protein